MGRLTICILLVPVVMWATCLQAHDQARKLPNEPHSALPWLKLDSLSATRERPLFAPDRRKPAPPPVAPVAVHPEAISQTQVPQKAKLELTGIIVGPSETIVLLRDPTTSESITIHPGEKVGRWLVSLDSNDNVTLKDGAEELRLEMYPEP